MPRFRMLAVAALACCATLVGVMPAVASDGTGAPLPKHVFAPYYFDTTDTLATTSEQSGAKYVTMAFLQTQRPGSCTVEWNGDPATPVDGSVYGAGIAAIRAAGGDVVPSFGGSLADTTGTELADSCTDVNAIAAEYERVITTLRVTRLDFDIEELSLSDPANLPGIDRRNKAIALVEQWAARTDRTVQFVYTIPTNVGGVEPTAVHLLQNAVENNARIDIVNIMTFDYYDAQSYACAAGTGPAHEMGADTLTAAGHLDDTLRAVYPHKASTQIWRMIGLTEDIGRDDFGPCETFTTGDAVTVEGWAASHGIGELSFWNLQRDNPARSHVPQEDWQFSHTFDPFTHH